MTPTQLPAWRSAIGVDLSGSSLVAVRATRSRGGVRFDPPQTRIAPSRDEPVAAALPIPLAPLRILAAPFASPAKALRVFPSLLDVELPFPIEDCASSFVDLRRAAGARTEATAVAARREDVAARLTALQAAGVDPWILDHEALALWDRSTAEVPGTAARLVLYLGSDRTSWAWGRGPRLESASGLRASSATGGPQVADRIRQFLRAARADAQPWQVAWCGPGAADETTRAALAARIGIGEDTRQIVHKDPSSFLARALAARAIRPGPTACNLRAAADTHPRLAAAQRRSDTARHIALLVAALLLIAVNVGWNAYLEQRKNILQREVVRLAASIAGTDRLPRGQEVLVAERAADERAPKAAPLRRMFEPSILTDLAILVREAGAAGVDIDVASIRAQALAANGTADDWTWGETLQQRLQENGWVIELDRRDAGADERVHFAIRGAR